MKEYFKKNLQEGELESLAAIPMDVHIKSPDFTTKKANKISINLLVLYEIADKSSQVKTKKAYEEFEQWVRQILQTYQDAAIEKVAKIHLFKLRDQFSY